MRRTPRACAIPLVIGMLLAMPGVAVAQPGSQDIAGLVAAVANANQKLQDLGAAIQAQQESVNKAIVDVQTARDNAAAAQQEVDASAQRVQEANTAITAAQQRFDTFAAATYVNGPSDSYLTASDPADIINTAAAGQTLSVSSQQVITNLQRARTEQVNKESAARLAKQNADKAVADAEASQQTAVSALTQAQQTFGSQQAELDRLTSERAAAQAKLDEARNWSAPVAGRPAAQPAAAASGDAAANWDRAPGAREARTGNWDTAWDPTLPAIPSAFVSGDPIAIINTILGYASTSAQVTQQMGHNFLQKLGLLPNAQRLHQRRDSPRLRQAGLRVRHQRAASQMGVPYSWGGGNAAGAEPRHRLRRGHSRFRLLGADAVHVRRRRHQARPLLGLAVQRGPQDPVVADAPRRHDLLRAQRQPARRDVPRRRPDARGAVHRVGGEGLAGAHQRHDPVRRPDYIE